MSATAIQRCVISMMKGFTLSGGAAMFPALTVDGVDHPVVVGDEPDVLSLGVNSFAMVSYKGQKDATPLGFGSTHDRYMKTDWLFDIFCIFRTGLRVEEQETTIARRAGELMSQFQMFPTLAGYRRNFLTPDPDWGYADPYGLGVANQIILAEVGGYSRFSPLAEPFSMPDDDLSGLYLDYKVREAYIMELGAAIPVRP